MSELVLSWASVVNALGGLAMIGFGAWVLTLHPRTRATRTLAVFAIAAGAIFVPGNLIRWTAVERFALWFPYSATVATVAGLALLGLIHEMLGPVEGATLRLWRVALGTTAFFLVVPLAFGAFTGFESSPDRGLFWFLSGQLNNAGFNVFLGAMFAVPVVLGLRFRDPSERDDPRVRVEALTVSAALVFWPALFAGNNVVRIADPTQPVGVFGAFSVLLFGGYLLLSGLWIANANRAPELGTGARNVGLLILGLMVLGMIESAFSDTLPWLGSPLFGVARLLTVAGLGYAILRHRFLGIDARFRWGVSKTTVAGIFVTVFFVVSEGAQLLFAEFADGNELLGVAAAGLLVFFLAPIQRAADELAERMVPAGSTAGARAAKRYREAVRMALADGEIGPGEEDQLAEHAEQLGLGPRRALELRREVEQDLDA